MPRLGTLTQEATENVLGKALEACERKDVAVIALQYLDGPNRQSPIASVRRTQSTLEGHSAVPCGTNTTPMNANRAIRIAAQRTQAL